MEPARFDAVVVGAGPAGSVAALVLARGGARVALVDRAEFPRDKACGDLVGPRGVQLLEDLALLEDLGLALPGATAASTTATGHIAVGDMVVVGPSGRRVRLPCYPGRTYPGHGLAVPRARFDAGLREAAVISGAHPVLGRARELLNESGRLVGVQLDDGRRLLADVAIAADGASSTIATAAGLVAPPNVLWGFAVRSYVEAAPSLPHIVLWEPERRRAFPGYGWLFPGPGGLANIGLGLGMGADRRAAGRAARCLAAFVEHLRSLGLLDAVSGAPLPRPLGGWLKLGMVGTAPARDRVLAVGDAAGLVNALQGEGISQAMASGRAAAESVLAGPEQASARYGRFLATAYAPYHQMTAPVHRTLVHHPAVVSAVGRVLTAPGVGRAVAGAWSIFWNDLIDGAEPRPSRTLAASAARLGAFVTGHVSKRGPA